MKLRLSLLLLLWSAVASDEADAAAPHLSCKDENNNNVDWYILYKAPNVQRYIYISANGEEKTNKDIGNSNGVLANTLSPMFHNDMPNSFGFLSYNDQPPNKQSLTDTADPEVSGPGSFGHSKGVVLGDSATQTALWLTHSTPKFPANKNQNSFWPSTGNKNAQTFMCVTLKFSELVNIGTHLKFIHALTFDKIIPNTFPQEMIDAGNNKGGPPSPNPFIQNLKVGNKQLRTVAKVTGKTAQVGDLYVQLTREFSSDMDVKPWGCQAGKDQSYCQKNQHKVMNVIQVKTSLGDWRWTVDHSKWAVTTDNNIDWTCIADMNRAPSQYERPGGALCINDHTVSNLFRGYVKERLDCGKDPKDPSKDCTSLYLGSHADSLPELHLSVISVFMFSFLCF